MSGSERVESPVPHRKGQGYRSIGSSPVVDSGRSGTTSLHIDLDLDALVPPADLEPTDRLHLLQLRRDILDRVFNIEEARGKFKRHLALIDQLSTRLREDETLVSWSRLDIEGRMDLARAGARACTEKIKHWEHELAALLALYTAEED